MVRPSVAASHPYRVPAYPGISVKLNQNECPFDLPEELKRALVEQFLEEPWNRYPDEFGAELRKTVARRVGWTADGVLLGNGSNELAQFLGFTLIESGTPVVLLDPMFALFSKIVGLHGGVEHSVRCEHDFSTDPAKIIETAQRVDARFTMVASPNNPTGRAIPVDQLERVANEIPGLLLIDEAYHEFVEGRPATALLDSHPNVLVLRTLSKTVGIAGLRFGYLLAHPSLIAEILKARLPFMINRLTSVVADYLMRHPDVIDERVDVLKAERQVLYGALSGMEGVEAIPSDTNFIIFSTPRPACEVETSLAERGVLVRDVSGYRGMDRFIRVNTGLPSENKAFLSALNHVLFSG
ncbi:MAG: histidinol-phosphate transaminase [Rhodothermia bacterium]